MSEEITKLIEEKTEFLYNSLMEKPRQVLSIFNDFFGENNVDMQGYCSLSEFREFLNTVSISAYIYNSNIIDVNSDEWNKYEGWTINELPENIAVKVANAFRVNSVFGRVSIMKFNNLFILVHFPHVRVTNEHNRFTDINHLWAKIRISCDGTMDGGFTLNRSEYTLLHFKSDYMHSHVYSIPTSDFTQFQSPCTGSGPINGTISALNTDYNEDTWRMFCLELSKYVTVESIAGRPYHYLERLGTNDYEGINEFRVYNENYITRLWSSIKIKTFIEYFIKLKKLKFNYVNNSFSIGMSFVEYMVLISNEFISWYNKQFNDGIVCDSVEELKNENILKECIIANGKVYPIGSTLASNYYSRYIGRKVCTFKGRDIVISITGTSEVEDTNRSLILNMQVALYILSQILKVLNYRYGRSKAIYEANKVGTDVRYL